MDISNTIKINALAKELVKKGLAPSSEDASKMAQQIMQEEIEDSPKQQKVVDSTEKYEILLERTTRKVGHEITALKEQITAISTELRFLKDDLKQIRSNQLQSQVNTPQKIEVAKEEPIVEKQEVLKKPVQEEKSASKEEFTPEDVAVDKIFYFGKK